MSVKPFAEQGHYTGIHDAIFDDVMPICPANAWKVLCFVIRKTRGWQKDSDRLSYAQIRKGSGIKSDATIRKALDWLTHEDHRLLKAEAGKDAAGRQEPTLYSLNRDFELENPSTENEQPSTVSKDGSVYSFCRDNNQTEEQEPHFNNQVVVEATLPDDVTSRCLLLLKNVKGIRKDYGELALLLAELREEFPSADPESVCRDYEFNHRVGKEKTKVHATKLRNYFRVASQHRNGKRRTTKPPEKVAQRDVKEGYEWFFRD